MTVLTIMTVIREEKRRASKHKREREGRHSRGWNLIRDKLNIKRKEEEEEDSEVEGKVEEGEEEGVEGRIMTVEGTVEGRIMTDAKIQAVERIEDAASLVSGLLRFEPVCCRSQFPIAPF